MVEAANRAVSLRPHDFDVDPLLGEPEWTWLKFPDAPHAGDVDPLLSIVDENRTGAFD